MRLVESKAYLRLRQLQDRGLWNGVPPVPIDHVLEHLLGLSISWEVVEEGPGEEILACLRPQTREVVLNESYVDLFSQKPGLERFSKGHEAGHADVFALSTEQDQLGLLAPSCYAPRKRSASRGEVAVVAERLKSLQPEIRTEVMRELLNQERARRAAGEDSPLERRSVDHYAAVLLMPEDLMREAIREKDPSQWSELYRLSEEFEVTISALVVRMKEMGLIFDVVDKEILLRNPAEKGQGELF